ncbi:MAG: hypothetical protein JWR70_1591 [Modestobacter sp.]|jgi:hypothetical protein|nr:hypothetical protein [Modestobacter sp.]
MSAPSPRRSVRSRRVTRTAALTMGALAVGAAAAPAALAVQDPTAPESTPETARTAAPRILTPSPVAYLGTPGAPVDFGVGKATVSIAPEEGSSYPEGAVLDLSGATVRVTATGSTDALGAMLYGDMEDHGGLTAECTTAFDGTCAFPEAGGPTIASATEITLLPGVTFTVEQVSPPTSGQLLLPSGADRVVLGTVSDAARGLPVAAVPGVAAADELSTWESGTGDPAASDGTDPTSDTATTSATDTTSDTAGDTATATTSATDTDTDTATASGDVRNLAPAAPPVDGDGNTSITFFDPGAYRTISVHVADDKGAPVQGATLSLCGVPGGTCADGTGTTAATSDAVGLAAFAGRYLPGDYQVVQTGAPAGYTLSPVPQVLHVGAALSAADTATAVSLTTTLAAVPAPVADRVASPAVDSPSLAYTGFEALPAAALAGGLLLTGGAALTVSRRRAS